MSTSTQLIGMSLNRNARTTIGRRNPRSAQKVVPSHGQKSVPQRLWDYGLQWVCDIQVRTSNSARDLDGKCPLERVTRETVDISEYLDFGFYDWVWYRENAGLGETKLGRWLGVSHRIGTLMSIWVLAASGKVISRTTVQRVTNLEIQVDENKKKCE